MKLILNGREFEPQNPDKVSLYVCGPTTYARPHLGNLRSAVVFDVLHRVLRRLYPDVHYVRNYTDVDDKIIAAGKVIEEGRAGRTIGWEVVVSKSIIQYQKDLEALNTLPPRFTPRVTQYISEIIEFIEHLITTENAYVLDGHVLFDRQKNPDFFINQNIDPADLKSRDSDYKRHPHDFVLWKPDPGFGWNSPWSHGRPGWHIECSTMIHDYFGDTANNWDHDIHSSRYTIDIHGGGADLKFPHHENECAQSIAFSGKPLANHWLHNGMLTFDGKMSKSAGNVVNLDGLDPLVVRYFFLTGLYSQPLAYSEEAMVNSTTSIKALHRAIEKTRGVRRSEYLGPLLDNLNTPRAISALHGMARDINRGTAGDELKANFNSLIHAMGLEKLPEAPSIEIDERQLARLRARKAGDFETADRLRDEMVADGVVVNDNQLSDLT